MKRIITPAIFLSSSIVCTGLAETWTAPRTDDSRRNGKREDALRTAEPALLPAA